MLPTIALTAIARLEQAGFSAYAVGGCVRDFCRGVTASDIDITTSARPQDILQVFCNDRCIPTGLQHGTVTVLLENTPLEITTFRTDGAYSDSRHPDTVTFTDSLTDDLARRDFTVNAMAYHPTKGLIDPFGGQQDLQSGILRCVGDPTARFTEDALRIARMLRFLSVLDMSPDQHTEQAALALCSRLDTVAAERKRVEWMKAMSGKGFLRVATLYPSIVCAIIPSLTPLVGFDQHSSYHAYDVYTHTMHAVCAAGDDPIVQLAALFHDSGKPSTFSIDDNGEGHFYSHAGKSYDIANDSLHALRFDNATIDAVLPLIRHHHDEIHADRRAVRRLLFRFGEATLRRLLALKAADAAACRPDRPVPDFSDVYAMIDTILDEQDCFSKADLQINGHDLLSIGIAAGPSVGEMLDILLEAVISDTCKNERDALLQLAKERNHHG